MRQESKEITLSHEINNWKFKDLSINFYVIVKSWLYIKSGGIERFNCSDINQSHPITKGGKL